MRLIYSLAIYFYTGLIYLVSPFNNKAKLWLRGRKGWKSELKKRIVAGDRIIWIHCASLGEFEQGRPVIEMIREREPGSKILLTFFSPSGYEIRKNWPFADYICYLPADIPGNAESFVQIVKPAVVLFVKYEFWNNYITALHRRKIPVYLISAIFRPGQVFFRWYGGFFRSILRKYRHIFVQDNTSEKLLSATGISSVSVTGDTRFDRVHQIAAAAKEIPVIENFGRGEKILLAGSSWPQDEEIIAEYINNYPGRLKWIFAPHEIDSANIDRLEKLLKVKHARYSEGRNDFNDVRVMIIDNIGLLSSAYRYAYIAAVGGGFGKGIHNILEPACWGIPVMFGPNYKKFREAVELINEECAVSFNSFESFRNSLDRLLEDKAFYLKSAKTASQYITKNTGASGAIMAEIFKKDIDRRG
jgi:3-deoxy-D-manno-octulosonic-acid transferase